MNLITYLRLRAFGRDTKGQDLVEYAMLVALIALACGAALSVAEGGISNAFQAISDRLEAAIS